MKNPGIVLILMASVSAQASCPMYRNLARLWESDQMVQMGPSEWTGLTPLFKKYKTELEATFLKRDCIESVEQTSFRNTQDGEEYRIVITRKDNCDGGNSYGYILGGNDSEYKDRVVAFIRDCDIYCRFPENK